MCLIVSAASGQSPCYSLWICWPSTQTQLLCLWSCKLKQKSHLLIHSATQFDSPVNFVVCTIFLFSLNSVFFFNLCLPHYKSQMYCFQYESFFLWNQLCLSLCPPHPSHNWVINWLKSGHQIDNDNDDRWWRLVLCASGSVFSGLCRDEVAESEQQQR